VKPIFDGGRAMDEEKLNQFLNFLEEDTKLFSYQREFIRTIFLKSRKDPHEVFLLSVRYGRAPINEFDAARILDGNPQLMNFLENPESPKS
jgi:hypothetical protein